MALSEDTKNRREVVALLTKAQDLHTRLTSRAAKAKLTADSAVRRATELQNAADSAAVQLAEAKTRAALVLGIPMSGTDNGQTPEET